jgi:hypothetical protein
MRRMRYFDIVSVRPGPLTFYIWLAITIARWNPDAIFYLDLISLERSRNGWRLSGW